MKWGVQHVKVTLESDSGETVVIEQSPDGRVKCEPGKAGKSERAANQPPRAAEPRAAPPTEAPPKSASERQQKGDARKAEVKPKSKPAEKKPRGPRKSGPQNGGRGTSLEWVPVKDHEYDGFAAPSAAGQFKVLISKDSQWALFYELKGTWPKHIACFRKVGGAKKRAQELHDAGWPESEFGPITAGQVGRACPAPRGEREDEGDEQMETKQRTEEKPAAPEPEPKGAGKTDAERDKELMGSFSSELDTVLDEDEDD